jgi:hypothetical protein
VQVSLTTLPQDKHFRGAGVVTFRSAWEDRNAVFLGFKAGDNKANHSNLDLGTFVLDALGVRWALDLGADDYNLPGYFGGQRWNYYRLRAEGHNTLVLNPGAAPDQDPRAAASIVKFSSEPGRAFAVVDLTPAYARHAQRVRRGLALLDRRCVLVQDEVRADTPADGWWFLHTRADVKVGGDGRVAILTEGNARLEARLQGPQDAVFTVLEAEPLPGSPQPTRQNPNKGVRKLAIRFKAVKDLTLGVLLTPLKEGEPEPAPLSKLTPLNDW